MGRENPHGRALIPEAQSDAICARICVYATGSAVTQRVLPEGPGSKFGRIVRLDDIATERFARAIRDEAPKSLGRVLAEFFMSAIFQ
jgi:hypothetical protein